MMKKRRSTRIRTAASAAAAAAASAAAAAAASAASAASAAAAASAASAAAQGQASTPTLKKRGSKRKRPVKISVLPPPPKTTSIFSNAQNFPVCKHVSNISAINVAKVTKVIQRPIHWRCRECHHCNDAWICLTCGHVGCGRFHGRHAFNHCASHRTGTHDLALCVSNGFCFCYRCDEYVISDNAQSELRLLQTMLSDVINQTFSESTTRRGSVIRQKQTSWEIKQKRGDVALVGNKDRECNIFTNDLVFFLFCFCFLFVVFLFLVLFLF